jgi:16S rRNA (uracil1498-N3)-methyltransferase
MRRRFFVDSFTGHRAVLEGDAAHHAARVLRVAPGQLYELSDGSAVWLARVEAAGGKAVEFSLLEQLPAALPNLVTVLLLSIVKFDRFEWALEKATELGVSRIIPLAASRSERALPAAAPKRARRWEKILLQAAQQSRRLRPPLLAPLESSAAAFLQESRASTGENGPGRLLFFSESNDAPTLRSVLEKSVPASRAVLAIGPEGGWTAEERDAALRANWAEVSLGGHILRTETAVASALAVVNYALGG